MGKREWMSTGRITRFFGRRCLVVIVESRSARCLCMQFSPWSISTYCTYAGRRKNRFEFPGKKGMGIGRCCSGPERMDVRSSSGDSMLSHNIVLAKTKQNVKLVFGEYHTYSSSLLNLPFCLGLLFLIAVPGGKIH